MKNYEINLLKNVGEIYFGMPKCGVRKIFGESFKISNQFGFSACSTNNINNTIFFL